MAFIFTYFHILIYFSCSLFLTSLPIPIPVSVFLPCTLLELLFPLLTSHHSAPAPPCFSPALFHLTISRQTSCLIYHLAGYWASLSTPTTAVCEHLIYIKIRISLVPSPCLSKLCWKDWCVCFCSSSSASSFSAPWCPGETESQGCVVQKTVVSDYPLNTWELHCLSPKRGLEARCNDIQVNGKTETKLTRSRNRPLGKERLQGDVWKKEMDMREVCRKYGNKRGHERKPMSPEMWSSPL